MTDLMRLMIALTTLVQVAEDLTLRPVMERERPFALTRGELPLPRLFDLIFSPRGLTLLLASRLVASVTLILTPHPLDAGVLIVATWLWAVRWRGSFNGGSDAMTLIVLTGTMIALVSPRLEFAAHAYVAAHLITSIFVAGVVKLRNPGWRNGTALATFLNDAGVRVPAGAAFALAWATMAFELSFPLSLVSLRSATACTAVALLFHFGNAYVFGLNRFLLAWGAAYPALLALAAALTKR